MSDSTDTMKHITVRGAREHNLKNIDVTLPRDKFIVVTGLSGSGKSTLAFDTIYAEGQRRYVESLSAYARQFLGQMNKPDCDGIDGLSPAISIDQKTTSKNPRSTVGTVTEIYDYLRLLFARVGKPHCPEHGIKIESQSPEKIAKRIAKDIKGTAIILAPIIRQKKGTYERLIEELNKDGYTRARIDKKVQRTDEKVELDRYKKHDIEVVIDRVDTKDVSRLTEAVENALKKTGGLVLALNEKDNEQLYSAAMACPECGMSFEELQPRMFSFNSPFGACEECHGLGIKMDFAPDLIISNDELSIADGAINMYRNILDSWRGRRLGRVVKQAGFDIFTPIRDLDKKQHDALMYGLGNWEGLVPQAERLYHNTNSDYRRKELEKFMRISACPACDGKRLKPKILAVRITERSIIDVTDMAIRDAVAFFKDIRLSKKDMTIATQVLKEIRERLDFLDKVGLGYLTLSRNAGTLSGGEAQRIRLATQIGSNLMGVLYILDEPSIGLHQRDNERLIDTLHRLRDLGNTLVVVEHDEDTIRRADYVIDMGPGAGIHGGAVVAEGTPRQIEKNARSLTGAYLSGKKKITLPKEQRSSKNFLQIKGAREHNLQNIDVDIPLGVFNVVTGVSGSGKSTLIYEILYKGLMRMLHNSKKQPGDHDSISYDEPVDKVIVIDQSPIGKTPRSNPATYTKVFDEIRRIFASTKEAKVRGYEPGRFSFNVKGGRCEACQGDGVIKIEMNFLPDIYVECDECKGKRYNSETLEVTYKGKTISDVLHMTVEEALEFFKNIPYIERKLDTLNQVGLDYIRLGQSSTTLSGGEAQRIKLTRELSKKATGRTVYLLDEPTTGLHFHDIKKLIGVLDSLVERGNTVILIEHNLDIIKSADHITDLGPEGGDGGGLVIASGTPEAVATNNKSHTGAFLKRVLS
jgi:excinuclease ABC subunit A